MSPALRYWELVFAASVIGMIVLYPAVADALPLIITSAPLSGLLFSAGVFTFLSTLTSIEWLAHRRGRILIASIILWYVTSALLFIATTITAPTITIWFVATLCFICALGSLFTQRLFQRAEHDMRRRWPSLLFIGMSTTLGALIIANALIAFPSAPIVIGATLIALMLVA